jgi:thioredoxin reductase
MNRKDFLKNTSLLALGGTMLPLLGLANKDEAEMFSYGKSITLPENEYDVIIVGGSYAGLSAALTLARCLRKVLVIDAGKPRNRFATQAHNALTVEGKSPADIQKIALEQINMYEEYLDLLSDEVIEVSKEEGKFTLKTKSAKQSKSTYLILATGGIDELPSIKGIEQQWGKNVHHCPYCHGFESRKGQTVLISEQFQGLELLTSLKHWCENLLVCFQGEANVPAQMTAILEKNKIQWTNKKVVEIISNKNGTLKELLYEDNTTQKVNHIYLKPITTYQIQWAVALGCKQDEQKSHLITDEFMLTSEKRIYAIGDISSLSMGQIVWSINSGLMAGVSINRELVNAQFISN